MLVRHCLLPSQTDVAADEKALKTVDARVGVAGGARAGCATV